MSNGRLYHGILTPPMEKETKMAGPVDLSESLCRKLRRWPLILKETGGSRYSYTEG